MRQHLVFGLKVGYALSRGVQHSMREWPHEKEQCMKTFAFERWCDRLQLPTATRDFLLRLRSSPPVRRVQGRLLNVCGTYASRKMGVSIQFESHTVELWAIYTMEYDREVLEFFDQPYVKRASGPALTEKRKGAKAAYQESTWYWELEHTTPRHGDRPWEIAHIDHTQLDIELLSSLGKPLGRPWATFLVDAYSRRLLAVYLTFDPPSYRSVMMVLRVCVRRLGRLPQMLVVDGGKEFRSRYFEALVNTYSCHKKYRPWAKPRYGAVIERLFGTTNTKFVFNLQGNTQASKTARQMTKAVNPKNQTLWQLPDLYSFLCEWAYEVYDQEKHPALGQSPREAWESGLDLGGPREHRRIRYDDVFRVLTLPGSPRETALVYRNHGIQFHYLLYWNDVFASPGIIGTKVKLRFDPFDISHIYVYVHNHWVECITSSYYGQLHGHSEREIMLASAELREQNRESHVRTPIDAKRLADFLAKIEAYEAVLLRRQRDIEN